jgi:hypothetical protein
MDFIDPKKMLLCVGAAGSAESLKKGECTREERSLTLIAPLPLPLLLFSPQDVLPKAGGTEVVLGHQGLGAFGRRRPNPFTAACSPSAHTSSSPSIYSSSHFPVSLSHRAQGYLGLGTAVYLNFMRWMVITFFLIGLLSVHNAYQNSEGSRCVVTMNACVSR